MSRPVKWIVGVVAVVGFLAMLYSCALPGDLAVGRETEGALPGVYTVNGVDPTGSEYSGTMVIRATDAAERFDVEWIVTGAIQRGVGRLDGDSLVVTWTEVNNATGAGTGMTTYRIGSGGELSGTWFADGFDEPGTEQVLPEP